MNVTAFFCVDGDFFQITGKDVLNRAYSVFSLYKEANHSVWMTVAKAENGCITIIEEKVYYAKAT